MEYPNGTSYAHLRASEIEGAMKQKTHWLNRGATGHYASLGDMAGVGNDCPLNKIRLPPHGESTELHHHTTDVEWVYVLSGSGHLLLTPCSTQATTNPRRALGPGAATPNAPVEEKEIGAGDYMAFYAGKLAGAMAHGMRAGPDGLDCLMGGTRREMDLCVYPLKGKSLLISKGRLGGSVEIDNAPAGMGWAREEAGKEKDRQKDSKEDGKEEVENGLATLMAV